MLYETCVGPLIQVDYTNVFLCGDSFSLTSALSLASWNTLSHRQPYFYVHNIQICSDLTLFDMLFDTKNILKIYKTIINMYILPNYMWTIYTQDNGKGAREVVIKPKYRHEEQQTVLNMPLQHTLSHTFWYRLFLPKI